MEQNIRKLVKTIAAILTERGLRLSIAESCTGGAVSDRITSIPGASCFFDLAVVSYSEKAKRSLLGLRPSLLKKYGTVSRQTAIAMAEGVKRIGKTDVALSVTGVAGPDAVEGKTAGMVWIAVAYRGKSSSRRLQLTGNRNTIRSRAAAESLDFLKEALQRWG